MMRHIVSVGGVVGLALGLAPAAAPIYNVVPDKSVIRIEVGKGGVFGFAAGHTHEVVGPIRGTVSADPGDLPHASIRLEIQAARLRVTGKGEPPDDVPKVQERMLGDEVLAVARHPEITFRSTSIAVASRNASDIDLRVTGELTLHGQTKSITVPVRARLDARALTASGTFSLKQIDFGIKPISVGGVVSVKDTLSIHFTVTAAS
jgi:polyisoprenoid-binding protein YceI